MSSEETTKAGSARLYPWLLLLPLTVLAWPGPGAPLAFDPFPHLAGTGIVALLALPAALLIALTRSESIARNRLRLVFVLWAFIAIAVLVGEPTDRFEARRLAVLAGSWLVFYAGGGRLDAAGRRLVAIGLVVLSNLWTLGAIGRDGISGGLGGVLGNSGPLSQAALAGAAIGAWFLATERGLVRLVGGVGFVAFVLHAGLAPVYAGGLALLTALAAAALLSHRARVDRRVGRLVGVFAVGLALSIAALRGAAPTATEPVTKPTLLAANTPAAAELGGVEVRRRIWARIPRILRDRPAFGLGPGQFQAGFPPYRDPVEDELSRGGPCEQGFREVEHAHSDWLGGFAELGLFAGSLWLALLALTFRSALRGLRSTESTTAALGLGAIALLANAGLHAPLTYNPASAAVAFLLFGALATRESTDSKPSLGRRTRMADVVVGVIGCVGAVAAWPLVAHGSALADYVRSAKAIDELDAERDTPEDAERLLTRAEDGIARAIEHAPSSAPARELAASLSRGPTAALDAWRRVLEVRPYSPSVLTTVGDLEAASGSVGAARASWGRALQLSPDHPGLLLRLSRLAFLAGDSPSGRALISRARRCLNENELSRLGSELVLRGHWSDGAEVLYDVPLNELVPETLFAHSRSEDHVMDSNRERALRCLAHLLWARDQVRSADFDTAVRSYRQVLTPTKTVEPRGAASARAELAAALVLGGRTDEARALARDLDLASGVRTELPEWAREALVSAKLIEAD